MQSKLTKLFHSLHPRSLLLAIVGGFAALGALFWSMATITDYNETIHHAELTSQDVSLLLEEHVRRTYDAADLVLHRMTDIVGQSDPGITIREEDWRKLRTLTTSVNNLSEGLIADADGKILMATGHFPAPTGKSIAQRAYFQYHRDQKGELYIGPAVISILTGEPVFTISRRLSAPDGRFLGIAAITVQVKYFSNFYHSLKLGPQALIGIYNDRGEVLIREPMVPVGTNVGSSPLFTQHLPQASEGTYHRVSIVDGVMRIVSYRQVKGLPLVVCVGIPKDSALAEWRVRLYRNGTLALAGLAALAGLTLLALRSLAREDLVREELRNANHRLERINGELRAALEEKNMANAAKSRFLAAANHDLRQPLQGVRLFLEVLLHRLNNPTNRIAAEKAVEALEGGQSLLDALADISTLHAGIIKPQISAFPIQDLLTRLAAECLPQAQAEELSLKVMPCNAVIASDPLLLERSLRNLLQNAIRHGAGATGRILLGCRHHGEMLSIEVWDTGPGIPADKLEMIFEDFYQLANPERARAKGLGLGLAIVDHMARLLGHQVWVRSQPGKGSVFALVVPLAATEADEAHGKNHALLGITY